MGRKNKQGRARDKASQSDVGLLSRILSDCGSQGSPYAGLGGAPSVEFGEAAPAKSRGEHSRRNRHKNAQSQAAFQDKYRRRFDELLVPSGIVSGSLACQNESPLPKKGINARTGLQQRNPKRKDTLMKTNLKSRSGTNVERFHYNKVGFTYEEAESSGDLGDSEDHCLHTDSVPMVVHPTSNGVLELTDSTPMVILPGSAGLPEVVLDRSGRQGGLMTSSPVHDYTRTTWGLGYVESEGEGGASLLDVENQRGQTSGKERLRCATMDASTSEDYPGYTGEETAEGFSECSVVVSYAGESSRNVIQVSGAERCECAAVPKRDDKAFEEAAADERRLPEQRVHNAVVFNEGSIGHGIEGMVTQERDHHAVFIKGNIEGMVAEEKTTNALEKSLETHSCEFRHEGGIGLPGNGAKEGNFLDLSRKRHVYDDNYSKEQSRRKSVVNNGFLKIGGLKIVTSDLPGPVSKRDRDVADMEQLSSGSGGFREEWYGRCHQEHMNESRARKFVVQNPRDAESSGVTTSDEEDDISSCSDSEDISEGLIDDYLENCEGFQSDLDDPFWKSWKSLKQVPIEAMSLDVTTDDESRQSWLGEDMDETENSSTSDSGNDDGDGHVESPRMGTDGHVRQRMAMKEMEILNVIHDDTPLIGEDRKNPWPVSRGGHRSRKVKGIPGQKKLERKDTIARKRSERALLRGFDLNAINKVLEDMVLKKRDMIALEPMTPRELKQVQRIANIYGLKSGNQGSSKKRFAVITFTEHTQIPSGGDKVRLLKILEQGSPNPQGHGTSTSRKTVNVSKRKGAYDSLYFPKEEKAKFGLHRLHGANSAGKDRYRNSPRDSQMNLLVSGKPGSSKKKSLSYANKPVPFLPRGIVAQEATALSSCVSGMRITSTYQQVWSVATPSGLVTDLPTSRNNFGEFEAHTKAFGSRLMAKMGYKEGSGLGREKQGIAEPLQIVRRPKSLGLGAGA